MDWIELSQITLGGVLENVYTPHQIMAESLMGDYDAALSLLKDGKDFGEVASKYPAAVLSARKAWHRAQDLGEVDWISACTRQAAVERAANALDTAAKLMRKGSQDKVDILALQELLADVRDEKPEYVLLKDIQDDIETTIPSGMKPLDDNIGGIPSSGVIVVAGLPGSGKTTLAVAAMVRYLEDNPNKVGAFFTLEMAAPLLKKRIKEVVPSIDRVADRLLVFEDMLSIQQIVSVLSRIEKVGFVAIDFADLVIQGEVSPSLMEEVYRGCVKITKRLKAPVMLLAQLSNYAGGLPRPSNLRWTRLAEALAWMVIMLYNPSTSWVKTGKDDIPPFAVRHGMGYWLVWKSRSGFGKHRAAGAIEVPFSGAYGWDIRAENAAYYYLTTGVSFAQEEEKRWNALDSSEDLSIMDGTEEKSSSADVQEKRRKKWN